MSFWSLSCSSKSNTEVWPCIQVWKNQPSLALNSVYKVKMNLKATDSEKKNSVLCQHFMIFCKSDKYANSYWLYSWKEINYCWCLFGYVVGSLRLWMSNNSLWICLQYILRNGREERERDEMSSVLVEAACTSECSQDVCTVLFTSAECEMKHFVRRGVQHINVIITKQTNIRNPYIRVQGRFKGSLAN